MEDFLAQLSITTNALEICKDLLMCADENWDLYNKEKFSRHKADEIMADVFIIQILVRRINSLRRIYSYKIKKNLI